MATTTYSDLSADVKTYIAAELLERAERQTVFYNFAKKEKLPTHFSKTCQFTRYEKLALPRTTLTEGTAPTATSMSVSTVSATVDQWGAVVKLTDVAELTIEHDIFQTALDLLKEQAQETINREIQEVLLAGTNVRRVNGRTTRAALQSGDVVSTTEMKILKRMLRSSGARTVDGKYYLFFCDEYVEQDIIGYSTFLSAAQLQDNEIGT